MPDIADILKDCRVLKKGVEVPLDSLKSKKIGLYFSAHWCPPCRGFTPVLSSWYEKQMQGPSKDSFELIFASFDRDDASFKEYYDTMPFCALDFSDKEQIRELGSQYGVSGIPCLLFLDGSNGQILTKDGRSVVSAGKDVASI